MKHGKCKVNQYISVSIVESSYKSYVGLTCIYMMDVYTKTFNFNFVNFLFFKYLSSVCTFIYTFSFIIRTFTSLLSISVL